MDSPDGLHNLYFPPAAWCGHIEKQAYLVDTPVGQMCMGCDELFLPYDVGMLIVHLGEGPATHKPWHRGCFLATILGWDHPTVIEAKHKDVQFAADMARLMYRSH